MDSDRVGREVTDGARGPRAVGDGGDGRRTSGLATGAPAVPGPVVRPGMTRDQLHKALARFHVETDREGEPVLLRPDGTRSTPGATATRTTSA